MKAYLRRFADSPFGVFGWLDLHDDQDRRVDRFAAAEDDWLHNAPSESCIPAGHYTCQRTVYQRHAYETFEVTAVPGRTRILLHPGNTEEHTQGCILVGSAFGALTVEDEDAPGLPPTVKWAVTASRKAFDRFMAQLVGRQAFPLEVAWAAPGAWRS